MAPSLVSLGLAALTLGGHAAAIQWQKVDSYNPSNFFDKFNFITDASHNGGFSNYVTKEKAFDLGMVEVKKDSINLRVESNNVVKGTEGRSTFRLESVDRYDKRLIIARFTHLPAKQCGSWPAFWTFGDDWPNQGEVDIYEGWNLNDHNKPVFHVGKAETYRSCKLDQMDHTISKVDTENCDNTFEDRVKHWSGKGCVVEDVNNSFGSREGGVYAMEWTKDFIKIYVWPLKLAPDNIGEDSVDTSLWGPPVAYLKNCDVNGIFKNQRLVLNVELCGKPVEEKYFWDDCAARTEEAKCSDYVAKNPKHFKEVYWGVQDIRIFAQSEAKPDVKPEVKPEVKPDVKPEVKADVNAMSFRVSTQTALPQTAFTQTAFTQTALPQTSTPLSWLA